MARNHDPDAPWLVKSRAYRVARAKVRLGDVQVALLDMARTIGVPDTLRGIADALNDRGLSRESEALYEPASVERTIAALGVDRKSIKRWRKLADQSAGRFECEPVKMLRQLREAYRHWHVTRAYLGQDVDGAGEPFGHTFVHPRDWVPPLERLPQHPFFKALSVWSAPVVLTEAWLGAIDRVED